MGSIGFLTVNNQSCAEQYPLLPPYYYSQLGHWYYEKGPSYYFKRAGYLGLQSSDQFLAPGVSSEGLALVA